MAKFGLFGGNAEKPMQQFESRISSIAAFFQAWHTFRMADLLHVARQILDIMGVFLTAWTVLNACRKFLSFIKETAHALLTAVVIIRSPHRYLVEPLLASAKRLALLSVLAVGFGTAWWLCCRRIAVSS